MDITFGSRTIAMITQAARGKPTAQRGFDVVSINIPLELELVGSEAHTRWVLSDLTADISARGSQSELRLLGSGLVRGLFMPAKVARKAEVLLVVRCSPRALAAYETSRDGGPVQLRCELWATVQSLPIFGSRGAPLEPSQVYDCIDVEFSKEDWNRALRSCGLSASLLVEIPFPLTDADQSDPGLRALVDSFEAFEHGGTTAWKDSIGHIRPYLEDWKEAESRPPEEPKDGSPADRTWKLLNLRDALHKCCHFWVHESKSACTRQDALLALSTFASLLNAFRS